MRTRIFTLILIGTAATLTGCAAGFRAGGERHGVGAGAAVGRLPDPVDSHPVAP